MLNFTVGPVMSSASVRAIGAEQVPYFRTAEFSAVMLENEKLIKKFAKAEENARVVFLTSSGTGAMEAAVMNCFTPEDKVLVIDGGSFGHRFVELLELHGVPYTAIHPEFGQGVTEETLRQYDDKGYTGFLVNLDETSVGVLYDIRLISDFCTRNHIFLVVDSISSFLCDEFDMKALHVQVMITGSQKALACPPGVALVVLSEEAVERVNNNRPRTMYFDLKSALKNQEKRSDAVHLCRRNPIADQPPSQGNRRGGRRGFRSTAHRQSCEVFQRENQRFAAADHLRFSAERGNAAHSDRRRIRI